MSQGMSQEEIEFRKAIMANLLTSGCPEDKAKDILDEAMKLSDDVTKLINDFADSKEVDASNSALRIFVLVMRHRFDVMEYQDLMINYGGAVSKSNSIN